MNEANADVDLNTEDLKPETPEKSVDKSEKKKGADEKYVSKLQKQGLKDKEEIATLKKESETQKGILTQLSEKFKVDNLEDLLTAIETFAKDSKGEKANPEEWEKQKNNALKLEKTNEKLLAENADLKKQVEGYQAIEINRQKQEVIEKNINENLKELKINPKAVKPLIALLSSEVDFVPDYGYVIMGSAGAPALDDKGEPQTIQAKLVSMSENEDYSIYFDKSVQHGGAGMSGQEYLTNLHGSQGELTEEQKKIKELASLFDQN